VIQEKVWTKRLNAVERGSLPLDVGSLLAALNDWLPPGASIVEVGCGGGNLGGVLHEHRPDLTYAGLDSSAAMIAMARKLNPWMQLCRATAQQLPLADASVDALLDGAALMHMRNWREALQEYARVARTVIFLHTVTVAEIATTAHLRKIAYGTRVDEVVHSEAELQAQVAALGFTVAQRRPALPGYDLEFVLGHPTQSELWVCRRTTA
jgi:ubiquinone/menaquinone biosynthesis C-methylase UbiE